MNKNDNLYAGNNEFNLFNQIKKNLSDNKLNSGTNLSMVNNIVKNSDEQDKWPDLNIDMISSSLKVIADLRVGYKLKIVESNRLAEDNCSMYSIFRYGEDKKRENIISFLDHLFSETERNIWNILADIRQNVNVDTNVCILQGLIYKIHIFLHRYENMRMTYKEDSDTFTRLGLIRDKFFTFLNALFRDIVVKN